MVIRVHLQPLPDPYIEQKRFQNDLWWFGYIDTFF